MKWKVQALTAVALAVLTSCGNNSSDKETTTTGDTAITTTVDPVVTTPVGIEVPATTQTTFETKYPQASNVQWSAYSPYSDIEWDWTGWPVMDTADYAARFNWGGTDYWAWYDDQGNWVGTVNVITDHASLPMPVNNMLSSQYSGYTITSVSRENDKNRTAYEVKLEKGEDKVKVLVDENGKVLKKKTVSGDTKTKEKTDSK